MTTIHDIVMGPPVDGRACGGCVACCKVLGINEPDLFKPADEMCMHCTGRGCGIYPARPAMCRTWYCAWMRIPTMPAETRPDRMGVVFTLDRQPRPETPFDRLYFVGRVVDDAAALETQAARDTAAMFAQGPLPVFLAWGENRLLVYPRAELADAILKPEMTADPALVQEGLRWMEAYKPFAALADQVLRQAAKA